MPVPASITDLSTTPGSNYPAGSETPTEGDNYIRTLSAFIAQLRDMLNGTSGAPTALSLTITNGLTVGGAAALNGALTVAGATALNGNTTIGNAAGDALTVNPNAITLANTPTITGAATWASAQTFSANPAGRVIGGTYAPTITNIGNTSGAAANGTWKYIRIGAVVFFAGQVDFTIVANSTQTRIGVSLPVASTFAAATDVSGTGVSALTTSAGMPDPAVRAHTPTSTIRIETTSGSTSAGAVMSVWVTGAYEVI